MCDVVWPVRNTVPVPRHWCFKRKYLQGKRGIEKPPFDLPDFIKVGVPPTSVADPDLNWFVFNNCVDPSGSKQLKIRIKVGLSVSLFQKS